MNSYLHTIKPIAVIITAAIPHFVFAQTFEGLFSEATQVLRLVIPILFILATIVFLWGIITFIAAAGNEEKLRKGKQLILWGLIGLMIMLAVWGFVRAIVETLGLGQPLPPDAKFPEVIQVRLISPLIQLLFVLATVIFLWGVVEFIAGSASEEKRTKGKKHMMWGIIGLVIMLIAGGIIGALDNFFRSI